MYKKVSSKKLPNLIETKYDNVLTLNFKIYDIEINKDKTQFIIESNPLTNQSRMYFITTNLDKIKNYLIKN